MGAKIGNHKLVYFNGDITVSNPTPIKDVTPKTFDAKLSLKQRH